MTPPRSAMAKSLQPRTALLCIHFSWTSTGEGTGDQDPAAWVDEEPLEGGGVEGFGVPSLYFSLPPSLPLHCALPHADDDYASETDGETWTANYLTSLLSSFPHRVSDNIPLYDMLNEFQKGQSHIAIVVRDTNERKDTLKKNKEVKHHETKLNTKQRGKPETTLKQGILQSCSKLGFEKVHDRMLKQFRSLYEGYVPMKYRSYCKKMAK